MGLTPSPSRSLIMLAVRMEEEKRGRQMRVLTEPGGWAGDSRAERRARGAESGKQGGVPSSSGLPFTPLTCTCWSAPPCLSLSLLSPSLFSFRVSVGAVAEKNKKGNSGNSLAVQEFWVFTAGRPGSVPGWELRPHEPHGTAKKQER